MIVAVQTFENRYRTYSVFHLISSVKNIVFVALMLIVFGSSISLCYVKYLGRNLNVQLQVLQKEANELQVEWSQLLAEEGTWGAPSRIQYRAKKLHAMKMPDVKEIILVK